MIEKTGLAIYNSLRNIKMRLKGPVAISSVGVEITTFCNAKCTICPRDLMEREFRTMSMELFEIIMRRCVDENVKDVKLGMFGEPLLDSGFVEKVDCVLQHGLRLDSLTTNASMFDEDVKKILLKFRQVVFSIHGFTKATFEKVNRGMNREKVYKNAAEFIGLKDRPQIGLNYAVYEENASEREQFLSYWKEKLKKGDRIAFMYAHNWGNNVFLKPAPDAIEGMQKCACGRLWSSHAIVTVEGAYSACCMDFNTSMNLGNVRDLSINEAYNGEVMKRFRKWHIEGKFDKIDLCKSCSFNYLKKQEYEVIEI